MRIAVSFLSGSALLLTISCADATRQPSVSAATSSGCSTSKPAGVARDLDIATCLTAAAELAKTTSREHPVVLYLDHSASIQGFLDPDYPTRIPTDFRSVLDRLVVGVRPSHTFAYGTSLREVRPDLGVIGDKHFYSDRDTQMEQALAKIGEDTVLVSSHILVGDARRGSPNSANSQFSAMRNLAVTWVEHGGTFAVASSLAPFKTVESDPSGCRRGSDAAAGASPQTCPLYAFAYIAPGDELRILGALSEVFENLYAWPAPSIPGSALTIVSQGAGPALMVDPWMRTADGAPVTRTGGPTPTNNVVVSATLVVDSAQAPLAVLYQKLLRGDQFNVRLTAKPLEAAAKNRPWLPVDNGSSVIRTVGSDSAAVSLVTRGSKAATSIVRMDLIPSGTPSWLSRFDAADANDVLRTYGLGRLFEPFRQRAMTATTPIARVFFVVN